VSGCEQVTITLAKCDARPLFDVVDQRPELFPPEAAVRLRVVLGGAVHLNGAKGGPCNCGGSGNG